MLQTIIQVETTIDQQQSALELAQDLVESGLAACVQVGGPIKSVYRWKGVVEMSEEWVCSAKTTAAQFTALEQRIRKLHSYDVPEIIATEIAASNTSYAEWLCSQVRSVNEKG